MITPFHAKYFAHDLTRRHGPNGVDRLSQSLFDASVDLNPHQIGAALFALKSPLSKGVLLADEVGLGKTIEAAIVLCQQWSERRRRLLVICPASLRKQWALELTEKFNLPAVVLDAKIAREFLQKGQAPLNQPGIIILSYNYANRIRDELKAISWHLVVIDEAHKLRNAYRESNKIGQGIKWATEDCRKLLLTATLADKGFLSRDISVLDLVLNRSDVHHVYPRNHLKKQGLSRGKYNQIGNFIIAQSEINNAIGDRAPEIYFKVMRDQCNGGNKKYGGITDLEELRANLRMSCLPTSLLDDQVPTYDDFLAERRKLMALKIKTWFDAL